MEKLVLEHVVHELDGALPVLEDHLRPFLGLGLGPGGVVDEGVHGLGPGEVLHHVRVQELGLLGDHVAADPVDDLDGGIARGKKCFYQ